MTNFVLDASALLALLLGEPGADKVKAALDGSVMSTVNVGRGGEPLRQARRRPPGHRGLCCARCRSGWSRSTPRCPTTPACCAPSRSKAACRWATAAAWPWPSARGLPALTAERRWPLIAEAAGVTVELIR